MLNLVNRYSKLPSEFYTKACITPFPKSYPINFNKETCDLINLNFDKKAQNKWVKYFSGQEILKGSSPIAMLYAGHQFGHYVEQLGDGRAILLGEIVNDEGQKWELHVKGGGQTVYSRGFDGRATLRSSIREYLISEAMFNLGVPTTRALCLIGTGEYVRREELEKGALIVRMSPSHIRFGSFEVFYYRGQFEQVKILADYCIENYYFHLINKKNKYELFFKEIVVRTAKLIAKWMALGFAHGVLNTDNMSIIGLTLDYGPYGFMENYDPDFIPNHSDTFGRYSFKNQPDIGGWNLFALSNALQPILSKEVSKEILKVYYDVYAQEYLSLMNSKLGLKKENNHEVLIKELLDLLYKDEINYTYFFREFSKFDINNSIFKSKEAWQVWLEKYKIKVEQDNNDKKSYFQKLNDTNPQFILRNYIVENAIKYALTLSDYSEIDKLLKICKNPFEEQLEYREYSFLPPEWAKKIHISCSS